MVRTQIQLPDHLHRALKRLAERQETSLADLLRRAAEYIVSSYPEIENAPEEWTPTKPRALGIRDDIPVSEWRRVANEHPLEGAPRRRGRR